MMLTRFGGVLYRARWLFLILGLAVVVGAAQFGTGLFSKLSGGGFNDPNSQSTQVTELLQQRFSGTSPDLVILIRSETESATDPAFAQAATSLLSTLQSRSEVVSITSYYSTHSPAFLSRDAHETFVVLTLANTMSKSDEYKAIRPLINSPELDVSVGGGVAVDVAANSQIQHDLANAEQITFPILAVLLILVFAGLVAAGLPLLVGGISILGAFAVLRALTSVTSISVYSINVVTLLGLGLAIDYALFIVTRFREELDHADGDVRRAIQRTMATAGRTVIFSGLTVSVSLLSLLLFPEGFLRSMGLGAIGAVLVAMLAALTILPALLAILGRRVNWLSLRGLFRRSRAGRQRDDSHGAWYRLSHFVMRFPVPVGLAVLAVLVTLGLPFLRASFTTPDYRVLPAGNEARVVSERLAHDFAQRGGSEIVIVARTSGDALSADALASLDAYVRSVQAVPGVVEVKSLVTVDPHLTLVDYQAAYAQPTAFPQLAAVAGQLANGDATEIIAEVNADDFSNTTVEAVRQIRTITPPTDFHPLVGGETPFQMDLFSNLRAILPYALLIMLASIFVLLFLMTGSVVIPIKTILVNIFSLSATFGALVWIFQDGHLANVLHFQSTGSIDGTQIILIFALAFGLSMDYEVFLLSRIKEQYDATGDTRTAIATGLQRTGWLITSAALLLAVVLVAFSTSKIIFIQEIGLGLAIAVLMDATLVRALLVPATMRLLGRYNWWAPRPLRALWRLVGLSEAEAPVQIPSLTATAQPEPVGPRG